jgi:hypothetical protein
MTARNSNTTPTARWLSGFVMAAGLGTAIIAGSTVASADTRTDTDIVNDIKIGNRSQFVQSASTPPPSQQTTSAGRPQTLAFKTGRFIISNGATK